MALRLLSPESKLFHARHHKYNDVLRPGFRLKDCRNDGLWTLFVIPAVFKPESINTAWRAWSLQRQVIPSETREALPLIARRSFLPMKPLVIQQAV
ncbi:MAG: hypothetical protein C4576_04330 [Desulfobacteraceae bacterium]|nr:MAG: hypothetical protein C4576_04330 [Desulfobacteraceae bacterium]